MIRALLTCIYIMTATGAAYGQAEDAASAVGVKAGWYAGGALHGLQTDVEHDGDLLTDLDFLGPRIYAGRRINDYFGIEAEVGRAIFHGNLWSGRINTELRMWNMAASAVLYAPWKKLSPFEPFAYVGAGNSSWGYKVKGRTSGGSYEITDSGSDFYLHMGGGVQVPITEHLIARLGYRYWRSDMQPLSSREGGWAVHPEDYYYKRRGLEVGMHWKF